MKVISGKLKGRNILGYNIVGTRPTMDRVKESIFSMIQDKVSDSVVLDLFAGSGNYGIEAISNYAKLVYFNDKNKECLKINKKNLDNFEVLNQSILLNLDYLKCLEYLKDKNIKFDLVFLDPPYKLNCLNKILEYLTKNQLLNINSYVIVELVNDNLKDDYDGLVKFKSRNYGEKKVYIYKYGG
ncbi:MAG: 16S rRNA (guanine(966)-N(2))-methyltransferase RsmD [Bacilli bacterium]|nr:16S rRNA (guanine(966)-N(2))-methyltransferase RsmD [Bacilli bacterium]